MASPSSASRPITKGKQPVAAEFGGPFGSPLAQAVLARDLAECPDELDIDANDIEADGSESDESIPGPTLYRRPSGIAFGAIRPALSLGPAGADESPILSRFERARSREAERSLLRDNHILPPKHQPPHKPQGPIASLYKRLFSTKVRQRVTDEESPPRIVVEPSETTALLGEARGRSGAPAPHEHEHLNEQWEAAVAAGQIKTTWQREAKTIATYSRSLVLTFLLQYSLNATSIFAVGRLGTRELGAVSLATMTASITCYAPVQGLVTSLDTLCAQAYGSGHKQLVGLQLQRMIYFLMVYFIFVIVVWLNAEWILATWIDPVSAALAGIYLRTLMLGVPAYMCFEAGKRFVQAQGIFHATTYVLLIAAPTNVFVNWLFVWHLGWGFRGAPLAVALTQNMLPWLLLLYVWKVDGSQAWGGFRRAAFKNWGPMIRLALPGMVMVVAEWFAFEILTLACGRIGVATLAAQSVLMTVTAITFQIPFPVSIAGSTRIANLIGANLVDAAKTSAKVTVAGGVLVGLFNATMLFSFRYQIPRLFTPDPEVIEIVATVMPVVAGMQLFDGMAAVSHGLLRGIGRQEFGGYANLIIYYVVALPISFGLGFGVGWGLKGLWFGVTVGLGLVALVEYLFVWLSDWDLIVKDAERRNRSG
ncbi:ethionine resistance-conferring protein 1 [Echria macrotheca]|uniref:Ethionine resistance-conferring protein 1 n=1 Tax=Echria macrotheca TaxID=438768 RepID=A0AAJ0BP00_9PEZI|nr:ethionine resistance-conferring protein 1 [Echria macrotheca]